jgi:Ca2+-binding EF-hand superfamily protein
MKKSVLIVSACFAVFSLTANELSLSNLNRVKVPRAQKIMNKMDKDNDGRISKQEAKGRLKKQFGKFDTNNDGFLTPDELKHNQKIKRKRN